MLESQRGGRFAGAGHRTRHRPACTRGTRSPTACTDTIFSSGIMRYCGEGTYIGHCFRVPLCTESLCSHCALCCNYIRSLASHCAAGTALDPLMQWMSVSKPSILEFRTSTCIYDNDTLFYISSAIRLLPASNICDNCKWTGRPSVCV